MYISPTCIGTALLVIKNTHPFFGMSFLAFKHAQLPIGETQSINFTRLVTGLLEEYYRPFRSYDGYYNPFQTSDTNDRWVKKRYPSTSLQRITTDTFGDALIHEKGTQQWGWNRNYIKILKAHLRDQRIPAFYLSCWLYKNRTLSDRAQPKELIQQFLSDFSIKSEEADHLFDLHAPNYENDDWLSNTIIDDSELRALLGKAPGQEPDAAVGLSRLQIEGIGPAQKFDYQPASRMNLLTGDNSLGKTFILDCAWWALTDTWLGQAALPNRHAKNSTITYDLTTGGKAVDHQIARFNRKDFTWEISKSPRSKLAGLAIYAKHDGSIAIWDPAIISTNLSSSKLKTSRQSESLLLSRDELWNGKKRTDDPSDWICNGLLRDWPLWQLGGKRYIAKWGALEKAVLGLFSAGDDVLIGDPVNIRPDSSLEVPTLQMPYGLVPLPIASAGVQRVAALAYMLVWAWHRHIDASDLRDTRPARRIVVLVDEIEAHLHPRWQRTIVPAIMEVASDLAEDVSIQFHIASHSPMVAASLEPHFSLEDDALHHLQLDRGNVKLDRVDFIRRGRSDLWLMSDVFGLNQPRSIEAEKAMSRALTIFSLPASSRDPSEIRSIDALLQRVLAPDDEFWPRWRFIASKAEHRS